jgi:1,4-alpha-glucan branching enzyme
MPKTPRSSIVVFSPEYPPHILGGLGRHVDDISRSLAKSVAIDLFVPERAGYQKPPRGIRLHQVRVDEAPDSPHYWLRFCHAAAEAAVACAPSPAWIHCHDWMTAPAGLRAGRRLERPVVCNVHLPQHSGPALLMENLGLVGADLVLVNSQAVRRELRARRLPMHRLKVLPNGVNPALFRPAQDWPSDGGYILFVGRFVPHKGVDILLRAFGVLLRRYPESRLVIAGEGLFDLYFRRVARFLGFPDRVTFLDWQCGAKLVELYQKAQVVVVPSHYEPFGIVALEAMACGRPVVASRVGGLQEFVDHGVQGYLVKSGDYLDLARRLAALAESPQLRRRMGRAARAQALRYSWDRIATDTIGICEGTGVTRRKPRFVRTTIRLRQRLSRMLDGNLRTIIDDLFEGRRQV